MTARFKTAVEASDTWLPDLLAEAKSMGFELMPWQLEAAELICALNADGSPRYSTVIVTVPRQSGKSQLAKIVLSTYAKRAPNQQLYVTAQTRMDAYNHMETLGRQLAGQVKMRLGIGNERISWENGSKLGLVAPTPGGAHGISIDFMLLDEVWALAPHVMAGVVPARTARPNSQLLYISTMGTVDSEVWNSLVASGRESLEDPDTTIAYLEYSADSETDVFDESKWPDFMPALGSTQTLQTIRQARDALPPGEFIRAFGNRVTKTLNVVFPDEWVQAAWRVIQPPTRFVLAVDVNEEPVGASIATGHMDDEGSAVRLIDWRYGTPTWVPHKVEEVFKRREVEALVVDFGGPARAIRPELEALCETYNVALVDRVPRDFGADTASFYDALREKTIQIEKAEPLSEAFAGAVRKDLGDLWVVSRRRMSVDASPLNAAIMAHGLAVQLAVKPVKWFVLGGAT